MDSPIKPTPRRKRERSKKTGAPLNWARPMIWPVVETNRLIIYFSTTELEDDVPAGAIRFTIFTPFTSS
jgi:hypothetical protein